MAIKKLFASINTLRRRLAGWLAGWHSFTAYMLIPTTTVKAILSSYQL